MYRQHLDYCQYKQVFIQTIITFANTSEAGRPTQRTMRENKKSTPKAVSAFIMSPKSENSLSTGKFIHNQLTTMDSSQPCLIHNSEIVTHFCQNCQYRPVCGLCLQEGKHKSHSVKNVEKASKIVHRVLTETLITIRAKSNLLRVLDQHIEVRKQQINNELLQYINSLNQCFQSIQLLLEQKKQKTTKLVKQFYKCESEKLSQAQKNSRQQNQKLKTMIQILSQKADKLQPSQLCMYYYEKKQTIQSALQEGNELYEQLKGMAPDLKWVISPQIFQNIKNQINMITIHFNNNQIEICTQIKGQVHKQKTNKRQKQREKQKQKQRQKQKSFLKIQINNQKHSKGTHSATGYWTPKHIDSAKLSQKISKQLKNGKKLQCLLSSQSLQKINSKNTEGPSLLFKKGKTKE